ncbi:MAG: AI-2E family transporter [Rhodobacteraceae bacterium]|nr:AI-2E family transporter [Paracoccaceae bacterium]MBR9820201.1 AI-2E family transporter [Paracoccaceae bacterium]
MPETTEPRRPDPARRARLRHSLQRIEILLAALLALILLWSLYVARTVMLPVVLGFLIALTLTPLVRWLGRKGVPEGISAVALIATIGMVSILGLYALRLPAESVISEAPEIQEEVQRKLWKVLRNFERLQEASEEMSQMAAGNGGNGDDAEDAVVVTPATGILQTAVGSLVTSGTVLAVALLFAMFLLSMGDSFRSRLVQSFPDFRRKRRAARISRDVERQVSRYLAAITVINAALGLCVGVAMHLMGMPYALLWGVAAFLLNYLPYLGAMIGVAVSAAVALVTYDSAGTALLVPLVYLVLTSIEGQMITPWMVGRHLQLNAASVFIAVVFWAWLWGAAGAVLAVPLLVMTKVLCDNVPVLRPLGSFLEGRKPRRKPARTSGKQSLREV